MVILGTTELATALTILAPSFNDTGLFTAGAYHKTGYILQEYQRDLFLVAVHDKAGCFIGTVVVNNAAHLHFAFLALHHFTLVGYNAYGPAIDAGITAEDGFAIILFKLIELRICLPAVQ